MTFDPTRASYLYYARHSDIANSKNAVHLQRLRVSSRTVLILYHFLGSLVFIRNPVDLN